MSAWKSTHLIGLSKKSSIDIGSLEPETLGAVQLIELNQGLARGS